MWRSLPVLVALVPLILPGPAHADPTGLRVRPLDPPAVRLLDAATRSSQTVRDLLAALQRRDVIVYLVRTMASGEKHHANLHFLAASGGVRYLRIWIDRWNSPLDQVALLAHELQHAVEIAEAPWVVDQATLRRLYLRIGLSSVDGRRFETLAAQQVERRVLGELLDGMAGGREGGTTKAAVPR